MVRLFTVLLAVGIAASALAQTHTISVFTDHRSKQPAETASEMQRELARVLQPLDIRLSWHETGVKPVPNDANQVVILNYRGACSMSDSAPAAKDRVALDSRSLASAPVSDGRVLPFVTVECDKLRDWLRPKLGGLKTEQRQELLGRAMGRLIAHEFYHIMAQTKHHASEGVGQSCFSLRELLSERFDFDRVTLAQMRPLPSSQPASPFEDDGFEVTEAAGR